MVILPKLKFAKFAGPGLANALKQTVSNHWLPNNQIVAILPFVWYKSDAPNFNWKKDDGSFYPQYDVVMSFPKVAGTND